MPRGRPPQLRVDHCFSLYGLAQALGRDKQYKEAINVWQEQLVVSHEQEEHEVSTAVIPSRVPRLALSLDEASGWKVLRSTTCIHV